MSFPLTSSCAYCGKPSEFNGDHYKYLHPECVMAEKQRVADMYDRVAMGLTPLPSRRERRALERKMKKTKRP